MKRIRIFLLACLFALPVLACDDLLDSMSSSAPELPTALISGIAWHDLNRDGIAQLDEPRLSGIAVKAYLHGLGDTPYVEAVTDEVGAYTFDTPLSGNFRIVFQMPEGMTATVKDPALTSVGSHINANAATDSIYVSPGGLYPFRVVNGGFVLPEAVSDGIEVILGDFNPPPAIDENSLEASCGVVLPGLTDSQWWWMYNGSCEGTAFTLPDGSIVGMHTPDKHTHPPDPIEPQPIAPANSPPADQPPRDLLTLDDYLAQLPVVEPVELPKVFQPQDYCLIPLAIGGGGLGGLLLILALFYHRPHSAGTPTIEPTGDKAPNILSGDAPPLTSFLDSAGQEAKLAPIPQDFSKVDLTRRVCGPDVTTHYLKALNAIARRLKKAVDDGGWFDTTQFTGTVFLKNNGGQMDFWIQKLDGDPCPEQCPDCVTYDSQNKCERYLCLTFNGQCYKAHAFTDTIFGLCAGIVNVSDFVAGIGARYAEWALYGNPFTEGEAVSQRLYPVAAELGRRYLYSGKPITAADVDRIFLAGGMDIRNLCEPCPHSVKDYQVYRNFSEVAWEFGGKTLNPPYRKAEREEYVPPVLDPPDGNDGS